MTKSEEILGQEVLSQEKTNFNNDKELVEKSKDKLKKEIKEVSIKLKSICNDAKFADELIDKLMSLKGQYDIEPTLVHVPVASVIETYDYGHFKLYRTEKGIVFHMAGMYQLIPPMMQTLYGQLEWLLEQKNNLLLLNEQNKEIYDAIFGATMVILMTPCMCFSDEEYYIDIATYITSKQNELFEKLLNKDLQPEEIVADTEFNKTIEFAEQLREEAEEYAKGNSLLPIDFRT